MPGSIRISPSSPRTTIELVQTHSLCRTQTPSATSVSIGSTYPAGGLRTQTSATNYRERTTGFEPATSSLGSLRSTN